MNQTGLINPIVNSMSSALKNTPIHLPPMMVTGGDSGKTGVSRGSQKARNISHSLQASPGLIQKQNKQIKPLQLFVG